uniref:Uncharacterized protein n=1 Tax=Plectus sambesii TaxID=2011161 RepID=A0A914UZA5_9BILA
RDVSRRNTVFTAGPRATGGRGDDVIPLTVERLRDIVAQPIEIFEAAEQERTEQIVEAFRTKPFEELVEITKEGQHELDENVRQHVITKEGQHELDENVRTVLQRVKERSDSCTYKKTKPKNLYELEMPEMFVY